jgi:TonB family protein
MKPTSCSFRVLGLGAALLMAAPAHGQQEYAHGNFRVRVQPARSGDGSVAMLYVRSPADDVGMISWTCTGGGVQPAVRLGGEAAANGTRRVVLRFDSDRADTVALRAQAGSGTWSVPAPRIAAFTTRTRTASRLVIRVLGGGGATGREFAYDLTGSTAALDRLPCARDPQAPGTFVGQGVGRERPREDEGGTYELASVEERPSPINTRELLRALERSYPPLLRDARVAGTVQVRFRVLPDGTVDTTSIRITRSSQEEFNQPTIDAVSILRFRPAKVGGRPVRAWVELPISWTVEGPPADSADGKPVEPGSFTGAGPDSQGAYEVSAVEVVPQPLNARDLTRALERNYPPLARDARVNGHVQVRLRVMADGRVDPESISIVESSHELFEEPTRNAVQVLRFRPARVNGRDVAVWVTLPIVWTPP